MTLPVLYSLRNCPYAMRARLAIYASGQQVHIRDLVLSNKPAELLTVSPKATVPVLVIKANAASSHDHVIDESLAIMQWAFSQTDPNDYLHSQSASVLPQMLAIITQFDTEFKGLLEQYRCAKRYHEPSLTQHRQACEQYLGDLERRLTQHHYLMSNNPSLVDLALMPFIRQFARVERQWYLQAPYPKLRQWLNHYLQSKMFTKVMAQYPLWLETKQDYIFGHSQ
ncbi:glutathione S-transferase [Shewanella saliphila]|uniref:Glutathione S-transferase n=1 Tax=Shewanella saliphila TaxID=2282698 RepID=A0ABQ2Q7V7_9GAMM|nr:glutathione S-transferase [Shewanella saliphila]MCL1100870.1 glutathione S-transferase [Shewanella saliphila]GGP60546.1 glutathione S-transferase [Shewanella saliphila]